MTTENLQHDGYHVGHTAVSLFLNHRMEQPLQSEMGKGKAREDGAAQKTAALKNARRPEATFGPVSRVSGSRSYQTAVRSRLELSQSANPDRWPAVGNGRGSTSAESLILGPQISPEGLKIMNWPLLKLPSDIEFQQ
jgi:hypothetical protein